MRRASEKQESGLKVSIEMPTNNESAQSKTGCASGNKYYGTIILFIFIFVVQCQALEFSRLKGLPVLKASEHDDRQSTSFGSVPMAGQARWTVPLMDGGDFVSAENKRSTPVYMSAPKHISELKQITSGAERRKSFVMEVEQVKATKKTKKKIKKKKKEKEIVVEYIPKAQHEKPKKKVEMKKDVKIGGKKKSSHKPNYYEPSKKGKYYEYRSVPEKGAWSFGYKRGNSKHLVQRKEHGHKSHFKTEVNWKDKKGKGRHVFEYNHANRDKKAHQTAHKKA